MDTRRGSSAHPAAPPRPGPATLDDLVVAATHRLLVGLVCLPLGLGATWLLAVVGSPGRPTTQVAVGSTVSVLQVLLVLPRGLRRYRLARARRRATRATGPLVQVRVGVHPTGVGTLVPAALAVWATDPHGGPDRVDAADPSAVGLLGGGRVWATVRGGPHRFATYLLEDGTPVVAAGRTNVVQRFQVRQRVRDHRRYALGPLDRPDDAPYPRLAPTPPPALELRRTLTAMGGVATLGLAVAVVRLVLSAPTVG